MAAVTWLPVRQPSPDPDPNLVPRSFFRPTQDAVRDEAPQQRQRLLSEPHALPPQPPPRGKPRRLAVPWSRLLPTCTVHVA